MRLRTMTAGAVAVIALAACSTPGSSGVGSAASANTLVVSTPTEPDSLDATLANTFAARLASWGVMLIDAQQFLAQDPLLALFPGIAIAVTTLGFNLLGDGLRDMLDPREL